MEFFTKTWWRFATGPNDGLEHEDEKGVWIRLFGFTWFLATPKQAKKPTDTA